MSLFRKYGQSLLDQPIGIEESRVRQQKEAEAKGTLQENGRYQRVARRAYRQALRSKDYGAAMKALDWIDNKAGGMDPGIMADGVREGMASAPPGNFVGAVPVQDQGAPELAGPPVPPDINLRQRKSLFDQMVTAAGAGEDLNPFEDRAKQLGVSDRGFLLGSQRARDAAPAPSFDSSSFKTRLARFGGGGGSLFERYSGSAYI